MNKTSEEMKGVEKIKPAGFLQPGLPFFTGLPPAISRQGCGTPKNAGGVPVIVSRS